MGRYLWAQQREKSVLLDGSGLQEAGTRGTGDPRGNLRPAVRSWAEAVGRGGSEKPIPSKIKSESLRSKGKLNLLLILHKFASTYRESSVEPFHNSFRIRHDKRSLIMGLDPRQPAG